MKKIAFLLFITTQILPLLSFKTEKMEQKIIVNIGEFRNTKGQCLVSLYNKADGFPSAKPFKTVVVSINGKTVQFVFDKLPQGTYAIAVVHDENKNNILDVNFLGIPKEGYGASGNNIPKFSAPTFESNRFTLGNGDKTVNINLKY